MSDRPREPYRDPATREPRDATAPHEQAASDAERGMRVESAFLAAVLFVPVVAGLWATGRAGVAETLCLLGAILFLVDTCRSAFRRSPPF